MRILVTGPMFMSSKTRALVLDKTGLDLFELNSLGQRCFNDHADAILFDLLGPNLGVWTITFVRLSKSTCDYIKLNHDGYLEVS